MTIWCERGADCKNPPGVAGNPKAHYNAKCPDYIRVGAKLPLLAKACLGTWWSCEGVGQCPRRWNHLSDDEVEESQIVVADITDKDGNTVANPVEMAACGIHEKGSVDTDNPHDTDDTTNPNDTDDTDNPDDTKSDESDHADHADDTTSPNDTDDPKSDDANDPDDPGHADTTDPQGGVSCESLDELRGDGLTSDDVPCGGFVLLM